MTALNDKGDFRDRPHPPARYELIDKDGKVWSTFGSATLAADIAKQMWPDQEQDEERSGKGWDVQVVGCDRSAVKTS